MLPSSLPAARAAARCLLLLAALLSIAFGAAAQPAGNGTATPDPRYLAEFPTAERVIADAKGTDALDTLQHQAGALNRLRRMIQELAGNRRFHNDYAPGERKLLDDYAAASGRLQKQAFATFDPKQDTMDSPRAKWVGGLNAYQNSDELRDDLLKRYFSPGFHKLYLDTMGADAANLQALRENERQRIAAQDPNYKPSAWSQMSPLERQATVQICAIFGVLLLLLLARELMPFDVTGEPPYIRAGLRRYALAARSGTISNYRVWTETTTTITERIDQWGRVWSRTSQSSSSHHEAFDLVTANGSLPVHVTGAELRAANGDSISGLIASRRLRKEGEWVLFRNHTRAERATIIDDALGGILSMRGWIFVPLLVLAWQLGSSTYLLRDKMVAPVVGGFLMALLSLPLWMIVYALVNGWRIRRFARRDVPKLLPQLALPGRRLVP